MFLEKQEDLKMGICLSKHHRQVYAAPIVDEGIKRRGTRQFINRFVYRKNTILPAVVNALAK